MESVLVTRYVTPLREGGSLPGLMEADDLGMYVVKFTGAGQGRAALVAEVICGELARALGLPVPKLVRAMLDGLLARGEPDEEVQHLLAASAGSNLGVDFLPGALDVGPDPAVEPGLAGRIVWLDALVNNVDRSWRNANLLRWHSQLYLIDHGAALTYQHSWPDAPEGAPVTQAHLQRFATGSYRVGDHVLLGSAPDVASADQAVRRAELADAVRAATDEVPDEWLAAGDPAVVRARHREYLMARFDARDSWLPDLLAQVAQGVARDARGHRVSSHKSAGPPDWIPELRTGSRR